MGCALGSPMNRSSRWGVWCVAVAAFLVAAGVGLGERLLWSGEASAGAAQDGVSGPAKGASAPSSQSKPAISPPKPQVAPGKPAPEAKPAAAPAETKPAESKAAEAKPAEAKPGEAKSTEGLKPAAPSPLPAGQPRRLAPGVLITIPPDLQVADTVSRHDVVELLAVDPKFDWAKDVAFRRDIFCLEFQFKPVRVIAVDLPQPSGLFQRKLVWYLVYCVTHSARCSIPSRPRTGRMRCGRWTSRSASCRSSCSTARG